MTTPLFLILLAAIGGIAGTLQAHFMGVLDQNLGTAESMFITYGSGGLIIGLVKPEPPISSRAQQPYY